MNIFKSYLNNYIYIIVKIVKTYKIKKILGRYLLLRYFFSILNQKIKKKSALNFSTSQLKTQNFFAYAINFDYLWFVKLKLNQKNHLNMVILDMKISTILQI